MSGAWVAFARTGNPNHALLPKWEPFAAASRQTMIFGHECRLLADPYFPRHQHIPEGLLLKLRITYDYAVRNGEWLMPYAVSGPEREEWVEGISDPGFIELPASVWPVARRAGRGFTIQFVNFSGLHEGLRWDEEHSAPSPRREIPVRVRLPHGWGLIRASNTEPALVLRIEAGGQVLILVPEINLTPQFLQRPPTPQRTTAPASVGAEDEDEESFE